MAKVQGIKEKLHWPLYDAFVVPATNGGTEPPKVGSEMAKRDAGFYERLRKAGFLLDFGEDGSGLFVKYLRRGSGYYIDVGASELIANGSVKLKSGEVDRITARYASPFELMHDLRRMGATNPLLERSRRPLRRATLKRMAEIYAERFSDPDGRIRATFEVVWLSGWAPHASQQQPLKPGSAQRRLADALGTQEVSAGEKTKG